MLSFLNGGSITTLEFAAGNTDETNPDLVITGVSSDASLIGTVPDAAAHRAVYAAAVGSDSFVFGATNGLTQVFGDLVAVGAGATVTSLNDKMTGGGGDQQRLVCGAGDHTLSGGSGPDFFVFADGFGADQVTDWNGVVDMLDVSSLSFVNSFADWSANAAVVGADVVLTDGVNSITFAGTVLADFTAGDFIF